MKKGYLQISFAWLFALVVGAFILFLAIYAATKIIDIGETSVSAQTGKEFGILLNPLETGFETGKTNFITMPVETRIYNKCNKQGNFGKQIISISQKSFGKWTETDTNIAFKNKYLFSEKYVEGEKFLLFSKPLEFPFKISDLIYITSSKDKYCFINAPDKINEELEDLNQENLLIKNCSSINNIKKVCFKDRMNCDIRVNYISKQVDKNGEKMFFETDSLMYAAIFSDKITYECQLKRLMLKLSQLCLIYQDKAKIISGKGCSSNLKLDSLYNSAKELDNSIQLNSVYTKAKEIGEKNDLAICKLW